VTEPGSHLLEDSVFHRPTPPRWRAPAARTHHTCVNGRQHGQQHLHQQPPPLRPSSNRSTRCVRACGHGQEGASGKAACWPGGRGTAGVGKWRGEARVCRSNAIPYDACTLAGTPLQAHHARHPLLPAPPPCMHACTPREGQGHPGAHTHHTTLSARPPPSPSPPRRGGWTQAAG